MSTPRNGRSKASVPLRLQGVLFSGIRDGIEEDPRVEKYTVPAVLSRRPTIAERELIGRIGTTGHLASAGYPDVELILDDRRLNITNTSLEELRDGLAVMLGALIRDLADRAGTLPDPTANPQANLTDSKRERLRKLAAEIRFH